MATSDYKISEAKKKEMAALLIIYLMHRHKKRFPILLEKDDKYLEPIFEYLLAQESIIIDEESYAISENGRNTYRVFMKRYSDFIVSFDVYSAVDLASGEFAFEKYFQIEDERSWDEYLEEERFEDLRIAVAVHKGIDPGEMVFLSFLHDGILDDKIGNSGWQFDLISGKLWEEIVAIIKSALTEDDLAYEEGGEEISGEMVLKDIIAQGAKLNQALWKDEGQYLKEEYPEIIEIEDGVYEAYLIDDKHKDKIWTRKYF